MRSNALIPILAEKFGVLSDTAFRIDRALAEAGIRAKGKGRSLPEMSRREALSFLIACMVADKITKVANDVMPWLSAPGTVIQFEDLEVDREWEIEDDENEEYKQYLATNALLTSRRTQDGTLKLIDCLLALCDMIEAGRVTPDDAPLTITLSNLHATVNFGHLRVQFFVVAPANISNSIFNTEKQEFSTGIQRECSVSNSTLKEIISRT